MNILVRSFFFTFIVSTDLAGLCYAAGSPGETTVIVIPGVRTYTLPTYTAHVPNVLYLADLKHSVSEIAVAGIDASEPGRRRMACRGSFPIWAPNNTTFEALLRESLITELRTANLYSTNASTTLKGTIEELDFASFGSGKWTIRASFSFNDKPPFLVVHEHRFPVDPGAADSCQQVVDAFYPLVAGFLRNLYSHPNFQASAKSQ